MEGWAFFTSRSQGHVASGKVALYLIYIPQQVTTSEGFSFVNELYNATHTQLFIYIFSLYDPRCMSIQYECLIVMVIDV